ncbi:MAG: YggS family pyridoxal phosphate-dependent enzyme [Candidatus Acidiferrum sp.]
MSGRIGAGGRKRDAAVLNGTLGRHMVSWSESILSGFEDKQMPYDPSQKPEQLKENVAKIRERITQAARRVRRDPSEITFIAVSKTHPAESIRSVYEAGVRDFGENRVQEWESKRPSLSDLGNANWHLIGHLQSNKANRAATSFHTVDSVDEFGLAQRLDRVLQTPGISVIGNTATKLRVLIEVRVAEEASKSGVNVADLPALVEQVTKLPALHLSGLMCIPPFLEDAEQVRPYFRRMRELRDQVATQVGVALPVLSMGMSHDFEVAIEEGATEIRVGTALFGQRPAPKIAL